LSWRQNCILSDFFLLSYNFITIFEVALYRPVPFGSFSSSFEAIVVKKLLKWLDIVLPSWQFSPVFFNKHNTVKVRSVKSYDKNVFISKLAEAKWEKCFFASNINDAWFNYREICMNILDSVDRSYFNSIVLIKKNTLTIFLYNIQ
jgi:hypothetical protein